jgi:DeoR/GlpR family transcriptional regulator of sugar metabolism
MNPRRMKRSERFERIIAALRHSPTVRISELAAGFGVSAETVRRDIDELSRQGLVDRTYGGAAAHSLSHEPAVNERYRLHVSARARLGLCAAEMVVDGDVLMIDSGSTTTHFAKQLAATAPAITVLTNCVGVALAFGQATDLRVVLCPGDYDAQEGGTFGLETVSFLGRFHATKSFIGASGLTEEGPVELNSAASWVKRRMIERSEHRFLLCDQTMFGHHSLELVGPLADIDHLITDAPPPAGLRTALQEADVDLQIAADGDPGVRTGAHGL